MENRTNADPKTQSDHVMFYPMSTLQRSSQVSAPAPFQYVQVIGQNGHQNGLKYVLTTGLNGGALYKPFSTDHQILLNKPSRVAVKQVAPSMTSIIGQKGSPQTAKAVIVPSGPNGLVNGGNIVLNNNQTVIRKEPIVQAQHPRVSQASVIRGPATQPASGEHVYATTPRYVIPSSQAAGNNVFRQQQIVYYSPSYLNASSLSRESNNNPPLAQQKNGYYVMAPSLQAVPTSAASASTPPSVDGSSTLDVVGSKRQKPTIISTPPNRHIQVNPRSLNYIQPPTKIPKIDPEVNIKVSSAESNHANSNLNATISNKPSLNFAHHTTGSSKTVTTAGTFKFSSEPSLAIQTSQKAITPALLPTAIRPAGTSSYLSPSEMSSELSEKYHTSYLTNDELKTGLTTATVAFPKQALASSQPRKKGRESRRKQLLPQPAQPARDDVSTDEADENQDEPHHLESRNPEARIKLEQEVYSERLNPQLPSTSMRWRRPRLASTSQSKQSSYRHFLRLSTSEIPSCSSPLSTAPTTPSGIKNLGRSTLKRLHQAEASLGVARKEETEVTKRFDMIIQKLQNTSVYGDLGACLERRKESSQESFEDISISLKSLVTNYSKWDKHPERNSTRETSANILRKLLRKTKQKV